MRERLIRIYRALRLSLKEAQPLVSVVGGVASLAIAYYAYQIDRRVAEISRLESQINRTMAIASGILSDREFNELQKFGYRIEKTAVRAFEEAQAAEDDRHFKHFLTRAAASQTSRHDRLVHLGYSFIQHARRARDCMAQTARRDAEEWHLCDEQSLLAFIGEPFYEAFVALRPVLYCDPSLKLDVDAVLEVVKAYEQHQQRFDADFPEVAAEFDPDGEFCPVYHALALPDAALPGMHLQ